ncbi:MAG: hypothetical protein GX777_01930 [Fastidiosipila sp.]|nr:hypothetical protein [Fastidiosipila sp.]
MGMLLRRHKIKTPPNNGTRKISATQSSPPPVTKKVSEVDYRDLRYQDLKRYAKEQGVDISRHRKKDEILAVLDGKSV